MLRGCLIYYGWVHSSCDIYLCDRASICRIFVPEAPWLGSLVTSTMVLGRERCWC